MDPLVHITHPLETDGYHDQPNLSPPITTVAAALAYREKLQALEPNVQFLMTLYLHPSITPSVIAEASKAGITGVKLYPTGVTTGSETGVSNLGQYWPVFEAMQEVGMVLNLHGEVVSNDSSFGSEGTEGEAVTVLNAEAKFLPTLSELHTAFPRLMIVLEHATTKEAIVAVESCGPTVAGTITYVAVCIELMENQLTSVPVPITSF